MERDEFLAGMKAEADRISERIRTCHRRLACPTCKAPVGAPCRAMPQGFNGHGRPLKHPHEARWTQETPKR